MYYVLNNYQGEITFLEEPINLLVTADGKTSVFKRQVEVEINKHSNRIIFQLPYSVFSDNETASEVVVDLKYNEDFLKYSCENPQIEMSASLYNTADTYFLMGSIYFESTDSPTHAHQSFDIFGELKPILR